MIHVHNYASIYRYQINAFQGLALHKQCKQRFSFIISACSHVFTLSHLPTNTKLSFYVHNRTDNVTCQGLACNRKMRFVLFDLFTQTSLFVTAGDM